MESKTILGRQWFADTGSGVWAVDASQRIVFWNRAAEELLGFTADQALGRLCYQLLTGQDTPGRANLPGRVPSHTTGAPARPGAWI